MHDGPEYQRVGDSAEAVRFDDAPLFVFAKALVARSRLILGPPIALGVAAFLFFFVFGSHVAQSSFSPQSSSAGLGSLAGLAAQFGTKLPGSLGGDAESLDFYAALLRSPGLLEEVARPVYRFRRSEKDSTVLQGTLYQFYGIEGDTPNELRLAMIERLENRVSASVSRLSNMVVVKVKAPYPELAQQINRNLLSQLNAFNLEQRQSAARAQREFVEARVTASRAELVNAEDAMRTFLERNRQFESDPGLVVEHARLQRQIEIRQAVFLTLSQNLEESRIEEVRNTPVITVVDAPELYTKRSRGPLTMGIAAFVFALAGTVFLVGVLEYLKLKLHGEPEFAMWLSRTRLGALVLALIMGR